MPEISSYLPRYRDGEISALVDAQIAVTIDAPKGVGKTETVSRRPNGVAVVPLSLLG